MLPGGGAEGGRAPRAARSPVPATTGAPPQLGNPDERSTGAA
jgi:hypothetical protein